MEKQLYYPILIFKVKEGVNLNPEDPNYDLFKLSCRVSAKRLFPNFSFLDAPFNLKSYNQVNQRLKQHIWDVELELLGIHTIHQNKFQTERGNSKFTTINLPTS